MLRKISGFYKDDRGDWVARLNCCHGQHVRHNPPFLRRPWVTTDQGRQSRIGFSLDCLKCDRMEWPPEMVLYQRSPEFNETSIPGDFIYGYRISAGTWGKIVVLQGKLNYSVELPLDLRYNLVSPDYTFIVPDTECKIVPDGEVRFFVEYYRMNTHT